MNNNMSMLDDINLPHSLRRSIWLVRDEEEGNDYTADEVLDDKPQDIIFNMRSTLTAAYKSGESKYVCPFCGEPVGLKIRTNEGDFFPFFSHYQDSDDSCPLKTTYEIDPTRIVLSSENQFKESILHQDMVSKLKEVLEFSQAFKDVEVDKVISTPEVTGYRRPSLYTIYHDETKVCFDALVSNPQIGLLVGRNAFYKMQKMFYLWVFPDFSTKNQRMCEKDILYMNRRNVFVFDSIDYYKKVDNKKHLGSIEPDHVFAYEESIRQKRLMLNCYWQVPVVNGNDKVAISWKGPELVAFEDIVLNKENYEAYYHDSDQDFYHSYSPEKQRLIDEWMRIKKDRWKKIFDSIEKRKILYEQALARKERRERLAYYYPLIESGEIVPILYEDERTGLFGYRIDDLVIIPPSYYYAYPFCFGYAWVKKKAKWGIINYKSDRICNFQYEDVSDLGAGLFSVKKGSHFDLTNYNGEVIRGYFESISKFSNGKAKAKRYGEWGVIDVKGQEVYEYTPLSNGLLKYRSAFHKSEGLMTSSNDEICSLVYDEIEDFQNGKAKAKKNNRWGIINEKGEEIYEISPLNEGFYKYYSNYQDAYGLMNNEKKAITEPKFSKVGDFGDGLINIQIMSGYKDYKWGAINTIGETVIPCIYEAFKPFVDGKAKVKKDGVWSIIDTIGNEIPDYFILNNGFVVYKSLFNNRCGLMNASREIITEQLFLQIEDFCEGKAKVKIGKGSGTAWGYINEKGEEVFKEHLLNGDIIKYESVLQGKCGLKKKSGDIIIDLIYDDIRHCIDSVVEAQKEDKWGIIDVNGNEIVPLIYKDIQIISRELFKVAITENIYGFFSTITGHKNKWGLIGKENNVIVPLEFEKIEDFKNEIAKAMKYEKWGILGVHGNTIIPYDYDEIELFEDGVAKAKKYGRWSKINEKNEELYTFTPLENGLIIYKSDFLDAYGIMDSQHNPKTPPHFSIIKEFHDGVALVKERGSWGKWGLVDSFGNELTGFKFDELREFQEEKAIAKKDNYWGAINKSGKCVVPFRFSEMRDFASGKAWAYSENAGEYGGWCLINGRGTVLKSSTPYDIDELEEFVDGKAIAYGYDEHHEKHYGVVSQSGNIIVPFDYDYLLLTENNLIIAGLEHKCGVLTLEGSIILPFDFDYIEEPIYQGKAIAKLRGKVGVIDISGNVVIPFEFDQIKYFDHGFSSAKKNGKYGIINEKGETVVPFEYVYTDVVSSHEFMVSTKAVFWNSRPKYYRIIDINKEKACIEPQTNKNKILIEKIREEKKYFAVVTGRIPFGVFIKIPDLGDALIPAKYLKQIGKSIKDYKRGMQIKVQLLNINEEKQQATFKIAEETN